VDGREDFTASSGPFFFLRAGQKYDLLKRQVIKEPHKSITVANKANDKK
jgi:cyanophycinase